MGEQPSAEAREALEAFLWRTRTGYPGDRADEVAEGLRLADLYASTLAAEYQHERK